MITITGVVLTGILGFGIFFAIDFVEISEYLPENSKSLENSGISEIPMYDGKSAPNEIPPHQGSAPNEIPPHYDKSTPDDSNM